MNKVHVIAVAYKKYGELRVFVQSWLNQSDRNWILTVIHDGHDDEFVQIMKYFAALEPDKIDYQCTDIRFNDYGHSLREIGLHSARGDYVLLTNADNYYIPKALEFINAALLEHKSSNVDVVIFDMVHSHSNPGRKSVASKKNAGVTVIFIFRSILPKRVNRYGRCYCSYRFGKESWFF